MSRRRRDSLSTRHVPARIATFPFLNAKEIRDSHRLSIILPRAFTMQTRGRGDWMKAERSGYNAAEHRSRQRTTTYVVRNDVQHGDYTTKTKLLSVCRNSQTAEKPIVLAIIGPRWVMTRESRKVCGDQPRSFNDCPPLCIASLEISLLVRQPAYTLPTDKVPVVATANASYSEYAP